jgi:hypothetical protein
MFGVAERRFVLTQPREAGAACGGFEGEALAQRAAESRLGAAVAQAQNLIEQREAGAGGECRRGAGGARIGKARPPRKSALNGLILRLRRRRRFRARGSTRRRSERVPGVERSG